MRKAVLVAGIALGFAAAVGAEQRPVGEGLSPLYQRWLAAKASCDRGGAWTTAKDKACERWYAATDALEQRGWCYGGTMAREPWRICNAEDRARSNAAAEGVAHAAELDRREALAVRSMSPAAKVLYRRWYGLYGPCSNDPHGRGCASLDRIEAALNQMGWCRDSQLSRADDRWHRCRRGDIG